MGDDSFENAVQWLTERGIPYESDTLLLEMGQPLRSREEARQFFALYHRGDVSDITDDFCTNDWWKPGGRTSRFICRRSGKWVVYICTRQIFDCYQVSTASEIK